MSRPRFVYCCVLAAALFVLSCHVADARQLLFNGGNSAGRAVNNGNAMSVEGDRNTAGQAAAQEAIERAAAGDLKSSAAASIGSKAAYMTTKRSAGLKTFDSISGGGRKLQDSATTQVSDRVQLAIAGASDSINLAVGNGANLQASRTATSKSIAFAKLATRLSSRASDFIGNRRKLLFNGGNSAGRAVNNGNAMSVEGDRNTAGQAAAQEAIERAAAGDLKSSAAASIGSKAAYMTTKRSAGLKTFDSISGGGRKLQDSATTQVSDRVQLAIAGASDTIAAAVARGGSAVKAAAKQSLAYAKLATRLSSRPGDFELP